MRGHKGGIQVLSEYGVGTTFKLFFPALEEREEDVGTNTAVTSTMPDSILVLVVDDEEFVREALCDILALRGIQAAVAEDGRTALQIYRERMAEIDLVILDLSMPGMSGEETFRHMRQINPNVTVLLSSGYTQAEATRGFVDQGLAGFIQKPYTSGELLEKVAQLLEGKTATRG
jgi:DNA-binding NtrC family response regulator